MSHYYGDSPGSTNKEQSIESMMKGGWSGFRCSKVQLGHLRNESLKLWVGVHDISESNEGVIEYLYGLEITKFHLVKRK